MFVIVKLCDCDEKPRKRKSRSFICERTDIDLHRYFFTVTVKTKNGKYDKGALERYTGKLCNSLIFPDTQPRESIRLSVRRLLNEAPDFLEKYCSGKPVRQICVCDTEEAGGSLIRKLLPFASAIHIISPRKEYYKTVSEQIFKKHGISLTVSEGWNKTADKSDLVITPLLTDVPDSFGGTVFTCDTVNSHPSSLCIARGIILPFSLERLRPPCTNKLLFACYLYEKCSVDEIESCRFENIDIKGGKIYTL